MPQTMLEELEMLSEQNSSRLSGANAAGKCLRLLISLALSFLVSPESSSSLLKGPEN